MCGTFGVIGPSALAPDLDLAAEALAHRGPDDRGTWHEAAGPLAVSLAQTRLAIVDLSPLGHQPMVSASGRYVLVYNGEVYNHAALRAELEAEGLTFRSRCDTEVVLGALIAWGPEALQRFVGMFALALWDRETETLLLARDRLGKKPLYYCADTARLAFSSETAALLAAGVLPPRACPTGLRAWLRTGASHDRALPLAGATALPPGHLLHWSPGAPPRTRCFWPALTRPSPPPPPGWQALLRETLTEAVRLRLEADVPVAVFLSGGVDSSAIAALAARGDPARVRAFTLAFDDPRYDERERASAIAKHLQIQHQVVTIAPAAILDDLDAAFDAQDLPSHDGVNTWLVSRAARQAGFIVALAGTGGDELFAGYAHFQRLAAFEKVARLTRHLPPSLLGRLRDLGGAHLPIPLHKGVAMIGSGDDLADRVAITRQVFSESGIDRLLGRSGPPPEPSRPIHPGPDRLFAAISRAELSHYMRHTQLRDIDVMSMAHGLEIRAPLLDHRVVELALSIPDSAKGPRGGVNKALLVEAAGLPPALMRAPKMGFVLPWEPWLRGPLRPWAEAQLFDPRAAPVLQPAEVSRLWRAFLDGRRTVNYTRVLALIALSRWARRRGLTA